MIQIDLGGVGKYQVAQLVWSRMNAPKHAFISSLIMHKG